jgi:putative oxidoreductase
MNIGLLILRLTLGLGLAVHGTQKLWGWFGGPGLNGTAEFLATLGFVPGRRYALMAGLCETAGGVLLVLGLLTPFAAASAISVMLVAVFTVHIKKGFFVHNGGYEYNLLIGIAALALAFAGPGPLSLDEFVVGHLEGPFWGVAALVLGVIVAIVALLERQAPAGEKASTLK